MASFEEQLAELETLVDQLERGDLTLEQSVSLFERGVHLSNACKAQLSSAESRIQVLLDPEQKGPVRVEELALAVDEGEDDEESEESEEE
jgi:exodeoxyribonuclease VII small subunit